MPIVTAQQLADEFGVTKQSISNYASEGMPKRARGEFDLVECMRWYIARIKESTAEKVRDLAREQIRLTAASAEIKEITAAQMRGELIPLEIYEREVGRMFGVVRQGFLSLPARIAPQLEGLARLEIKQRLADPVREILSALSEERIIAEAIKAAKAADAGEGEDSGEYTDSDQRKRGAPRKPRAGKRKPVAKPRATTRGKHKPVGGKQSRTSKGHE